MVLSKVFRGAKGGFIGSSLGIAVFLCLYSCGVKHNVDGEVDFNVNIDEIIIRVEFFCDKKIDGKPVYDTVESYRKCVIDVLKSEAANGESKAGG